MTFEELSFFSHYLYDKCREAKRESGNRLDPQTELCSFESLGPAQKKYYELLAYKLVEDFQLEPEKYLKF